MQIDVHMRSKSDLVLVSIFLLYFIVVGYVWDPFWIQSGDFFLSFGVSAADLEQIFECHNQSKINLKRL